MGDEKERRINAGVAGDTSGRSQLPAMQVVTAVPSVSKVGSKTVGGGSRLRSLSPKCSSHKKKIGARPGRDQFMGRKGEICLLPLPGEEGHHGAEMPGRPEPSITTFIERVEQGDLRVQYLMGQLYRGGTLLILDSRKAKHWLTLAAKLGLSGGPVRSGKTAFL